MIGLSATCVAIRIAKEKGTLAVRRERNERLAKLLGEDAATYYAIEDDYGLIEVAMSPEEVLERTGLEV